MRRTTRFVLNFAIALTLVLMVGLSALLIAHAPLPLGGTIARIDLKHDQSSVFISGRDLVCTKNQNRDRCEVKLIQPPLVIDIVNNPAQGLREVSSCQASYGNQSIACETDYHAIVIGGWQPVVVIPPGLRLSPAAWQRLEQQSVAPMAANRMSDRLQFMMLGASIAISILAAVASWDYFGWVMKLSAMFGWGCFAYGALLWLGALAFDAMRTSAGVALDFFWFDRSALVLAVIGSLVLGKVLWSQQNSKVEILVRFSSGFGACVLSWIWWLFLLFGLGYAD